MENIEIIPWESGSSFLVYRPRFSAEQVKHFLEENEVNGLRVIADYVPYELDFLKDFDFVKRLHVGGLCKSYDYKFDFLPLLPNLEELIIYLFSKSLLDLSLAPPIKRLALIWRKKKVIGLDQCTNLRDAFIDEYKEVDFEQFCTLKKLKRLMVRVASIKSLNGLDGCRNLEILSLNGCRYLTDISKLAEIPSLKSVHFHGCSQVHDFSVLAKLPNLERLWIEDTRNIESIAFIRDMSQLKEFCIIGNCIITDDDLSPAMNVLAQITPRKSYNMEMLPPDWSQRGGSEYGWWVHSIDLGDD